MVKGLIVWWHAALFMLLHSTVAGAPDGANCEAGEFHANSAFSFLDTQRPIIYTRARVSLLPSCSLEHGPYSSIVAEKRAVETEFLRWIWPLPGLEELIEANWSLS